MYLLYVASIFEVISTDETGLETVDVDNNVWEPLGSSTKDYWPIPVVPEPDTEATFKILSAATFSVGNLSV